MKIGASFWKKNKGRKTISSQWKKLAYAFCKYKQESIKISSCSEFVIDYSKRWKSGIHLFFMRKRRQIYEKHELFLKTKLYDLHLSIFSLKKLMRIVIKLLVWYEKNNQTQKWWNKIFTNETNHN